MAAVVGITSIKDFQYRGATEEWSNTYWFSGSVPADATAWRALYDALVAEEKKVLPTTHRLIGGYAYDSDADGAVAVWSVDLLVAPNTPVGGTLAGAAADTNVPGDCAGWVRWKTSRTNSKGKAIYLRKYFHGVLKDTGATTQDVTSGGWRTVATAFGGKMRDGTFLDGRTLRSRKHAETLVGAGVSNYITTRTLKRRGKRPGA